LNNEELIFRAFLSPEMALYNSPGAMPWVRHSDDLSNERATHKIIIIIIKTIYVAHLQGLKLILVFSQGVALGWYI